MIDEEILYYNKGSRVTSKGNVGKVISTKKLSGTNVWLLCIAFDNGTSDCVRQTIVEKVTTVNEKCIKTSGVILQ